MRLWKDRKLRSNPRGQPRWRVHYPSDWNRRPPPGEDYLHWVNSGGGAAEGEEFFGLPASNLIRAGRIQTSPLIDRVHIVRRPLCDRRPWTLRPRNPVNGPMADCRVTLNLAPMAHQGESGSDCNPGRYLSVQADFRSDSKPRYIPSSPLAGARRTWRLCGLLAGKARFVSATPKPATVGIIRRK